MDEVIQGIFIGDAISARECRNIRRVVNAGQVKNLADIPPDRYLRIEIDDSGTYQDLLAFNDAIPTFLEFMNKANTKEEPVLIHCQQGVSRSCSLMAVYLLSKKICASLDDAIDFIKQRRSIAFVNSRYIYRDVIEDWFSNKS